MYKIKIADRIDLYISDDGFKFTNKPTRPKKLENWNNWYNHWPLYANDNVMEKVYFFLDSLPERFKIKTFYQEINFIKQASEKREEPKT